MAKTRSLPVTLREGHDGSLACEHRDCSCCDACIAKHPEIVDVLSACFWVADPEDRRVLRAQVEAQKVKYANARH